MSSDPAPSIAIHTSPAEVPSVPPWFAEVVLLAHYFTQQGHLDAIGQSGRLARGRAGTSDVLDFVAILLGYAVSDEPTLEAFFDRLAPSAHPFMALFGHDQLPHRATLSRFLAAVDAPCRDALRQRFQDDLLTQGVVSPNRHSQSHGSGEGRADASLAELGRSPRPRCASGGNAALEYHPARRSRSARRLPQPTVSLDTLKLVAQPVGALESR